MAESHLIEFSDEESKPQAKGEARELAYPVSIVLRIIAKVDPPLPLSEVYERLETIIPHLNEADGESLIQGKYQVLRVPMTISSKEQFLAVYAAFRDDPRVVWVA